MANAICTCHSTADEELRNGVYLQKANDSQGFEDYMLILRQSRVALVYRAHDGGCGIFTDAQVWLVDHKNAILSYNRSRRDQRRDSRQGAQTS